MAQPLRVDQDFYNLIKDLQERLEEDGYQLSLRELTREVSKNLKMLEEKKIFDLKLKIEERL